MYKKAETRVAVNYIEQMHAQNWETSACDVGWVVIIKIRGLTV